MTHSLKNTWITIVSILAMLMSNYVSSTPMMAMTTMAMNSMLNSASETTADHHGHASSTNIEFLESGISSHAHHHQTGSFHTNGESSAEHAHTGESVQATMSHCGDSSTNVDTCCISVCSSVSYPTEAAYTPSTLSSTLALHHAIKIGAKVSRIQSLLRPPSA